MRSVPATDNVVPFRRPVGAIQRHAAGHGAGYAGWAGAPSRPSQARADQRSLMDIVYATGTFLLAPEDRETKLIASRLQVYGFLVIEEVGEGGALRRLRPSEAVRAKQDRPWRLSKASYGASLPVTIPAIDDFLFEPAGMPA